MPSTYVQSYKVNPGGSVTFVEVPTGSSRGTSAPQASLGAGLSLEEPTAAQLAVITFTDLVVPIVDTGGVNGGQGSKLIYTLPASLTHFLGANVNLTLVGGAGLEANASIVGALGTIAAANDNSTLLSTEATWVASTACTLTASAGAFSAISSATLGTTMSDDRSTRRNVYLNFAVPDAGITATANLTVNGTVRFGFIAI